MDPFTLNRRKFLTLSGAGALAGGLFPTLGRACPNLDTDGMAGARELAAGINAFGHELHRRLAKDAKGTTFFSPFSIETALGMTSAGARGKTLEEMEKVLHLPPEPHAAFGALIAHLNDPLAGAPRAFPILGELPKGIAPKPAGRGYELTTANAIWAMKDYPWRKAFLELTRTHYGAGVVETDFRKPDAARAQINSWVEDQTRRKIKDLIPPGVLSPLTRMVLTNAVYFKGTWLYQFDKKHTQDAPFTLADGTKAEVALMTQTVTVNYGEYDLGLTRKRDLVQVIELPYAGKELSMLVFLPENLASGNRLVESLTGKTLATVAMKLQEVRVHLPRFKAETEYSLKPALVDLGMGRAFNDADFTGMHTGDERLAITHVLHKAFVDVNEEGTEAAAATAVVVGREVVSAKPEPKVFRADRPFVFAIRDNATNATLFLGRYAGPK